MNNRLFLIPLLINAGLIAACAPAPQQEAVSSAPSNTISMKIDPQPAAANADNTADATVVPQTSTMTVTSNLTAGTKSERLMADNSKLTTTTDDAGNKVETRVFKDSAVTMVVVRTTPDGQKRVEMYYNEPKSGGGIASYALSQPASELESKLAQKPAANTPNNKPTAEKPTELAGQMPRDEQSSPARAVETPTVRTQKVVNVPQLPPVNYR